MGSSSLFTGGDLISLGSVNPFSGASALTVSAWINMDDITTSAYWFGRAYDSSITLGFDGAGIDVKIELQVTGTGGQFIRSSDVDINTFTSNGQWFNVCVTWDYNGGSPLFGMYADGVAKTSAYRAWTDPVSAMSAGVDAFGIGDTPLAAIYDFPGKIAYVRSFDRLISQSEAIELMNNPNSINTNIIASWDCVTLSPPDLTGNGFDGTNSGAALSSSGPPVHLFPGGM